MDYTPFIAAWDHYQWYNAVLKSGKKTDIWRTYRLTQKMGLPVKMPTGKTDFTIEGNGGIGTGHKSAKVSLYYNYLPPKP